MRLVEEFKDFLLTCGCKTLKITIDGDPIPQARIRFTKGGHAYELSKCTQAKDKIKELAIKEMQEQGFTQAHKDMPVRIEFYFYKPIPAKSKWWKLAAKFGLIAPTSKTGDIDNLVKLALDGINGVVMYDDCQVVDMLARVRYSDKPRTDIVVKALYVNLGDVKNRVRIIELEGEK